MKRKKEDVLAGWPLAFGSMKAHTINGAHRRGAIDRVVAARELIN